MPKELKSAIIIFFILWYTKGINVAIEFVIKLFNTVLSLFGLLNQITLTLNGDYITTLIFGTGITFVIAGFIMGAINAPRGKIGSLFGKGLFWLVGIPVSFALNFIAKIIFFK